MIAKNLKFLRKYYGDTQVTLAKMLKMPQGNISEYEHEKKPIPLDVLKKISIRYNVTINDLISCDIASEFDLPQKVLLDDDLNEDVFPILRSSFARKNESFNRAYDRFFEAMNVDKIEDLYKRVYMIEFAITLFEKAWEEIGTYVALSNIVSSVLLIYSLYGQHSLRIGQYIMNNKRLSVVDLQKLMLCDPSQPVKKNSYEKNKKEIFLKYEKLVYDCIKQLKSKTKFSELGDYYLALCYVIGFVDDSVDYNTSALVGAHMMLQLDQLENKYAFSYIKIFT